MIFRYFFFHFVQLVHSNKKMFALAFFYLLSIYIFFKFPFESCFPLFLFYGLRDEKNKVHIQNFYEDRSNVILYIRFNQK